jgi:hypothetical protein
LELIQEAYQEHLKIEGDWLHGLAEADLLTILQKKKNLNVHQIEFLAELLAKEGELHLEMDNETVAHSKLKKSLILFEFVETSSGEYSFERRIVIANVKKILTATTKD